MANQTSNFGFVKPDVNEFYDVNVQNDNWDKLDNNLSELASNLSGLVVGTYTGGGSSDKTITLGKKPKVIVISYNGRMVGKTSESLTIYGGIVTENQPLNYNGKDVVKITDDGFKVLNVNVNSSNEQWDVNSNTKTYTYIAWF